MSKIYIMFHIRSQVSNLSIKVLKLFISNFILDINNANKSEKPFIKLRISPTAC